MTIKAVDVAVTTKDPLATLTGSAFSMLLYSVGSALFGSATFRASVLPRVGALLLVVGGPLWFLGQPSSRV